MSLDQTTQKLSARSRIGTIILFCLCLSACVATPAPGFSDAKRADVTRDGLDFTVFYTQDRVEVIRIGFAKPSRNKAIIATMTALVSEVTGCTPVEGSLTGNSDEMHGAITCDK